MADTNISSGAVNTQSSVDDRFLHFYNTEKGCFKICSEDCNKTFSFFSSRVKVGNILSNSFSGFSVQFFRTNKGKK